MTLSTGLVVGAASCVASSPRFRESNLSLHGPREGEFPGTPMVTSLPTLGSMKPFTGMWQILSAYI
jgi:hypothetical protein